MNRKITEILDGEFEEQENEKKSSSLSSQLQSVLGGEIGKKEKKIKKEIKKSKIEVLADLLEEEKETIKNLSFKEIYALFSMKMNLFISAFETQYGIVLKDLKNYNTENNELDFEILQKNLKELFEIYSNTHKDIGKFRKIFKTDHQKEVNEFCDEIMTHLNPKSLEILIQVLNNIQKDEIFSQLDFLPKKDQKHKNNLHNILDKLKYFAEKIARKNDISDNPKSVVNRAIKIYNSFDSHPLDERYFHDLFFANEEKLKKKQKKLK